MDFEREGYEKVNKIGSEAKNMGEVIKNGEWETFKEKLYNLQKKIVTLCLQ